MSETEGKINKEGFSDEFILGTESDEDVDNVYIWLTVYVLLIWILSFFIM
jgi:hypothetical protein